MAEEVRAGRLDFSDSTITDDDLAKLLAELERRRKRDAEYLAGAAKRAKLREQHVAREIGGKPVFISPNLFDNQDDLMIAAICAERNCSQATVEDKYLIQK